MALRRPSSACAHGMAPRGDVAKLQGNTRGAERAGARRVAGGAGKRRRHGENREGGVSSTAQGRPAAMAGGGRPAMTREQSSIREGNEGKEEKSDLARDWMRTA